MVYGYLIIIVTSKNTCNLLNYSLSIRQFRGVAQLIARSVWDREVEGLSPFTPTKQTVHHLVGFLFGLRLSSKPETWQLQLTIVEGLVKRGRAQEFTPSTPQRKSEALFSLKDS